MMGRLIPVTAIAALLLVGCGETPSKTSKDVSEAREKAAVNINEASKDADKAINTAERKVRDAQQDLEKADANARDHLSDVEAAAMSKAAQANFNISEAEAKGRSDIAKEKCDALKGDSKESCVNIAAATLKAELSDAAAKRDADLLAAERH